ncbi:autism susceptibility gene 2 protein-like isoform X8 [Acipenser ruthenus]|uniref:autism susceptibility gene 2 protein-like isoform X8 n=1 Tax=Acipenser ruthenus TaxID=7906 RepID=UPI0027411245|nr:autism susceptibility gene 2 protein-like isoform X8 [Acipenser ruthenus]
MDGKMRQSRRSRSQRDQVRRRESASTDARNQSPSSGSDRDESPGREHASQNGKKTQNVSASARAPRPPRRKRRESGSQEEVIIDGFAISSFITLEFLEKDLALKPQERLLVKKRRGLENGVTAEPAQNGHLDGYGSTKREQDRGKKKVPLKKSKQMKGCLTQTSKNSEEDPLQELTGPHLSESSTHCFSGHGYSCDSESDVDDKASDVGSEKLFSPTLSKGLNSNENLESKTSSSTKVSGLQRSQEQSTEVPFVPPAPSPIPASPPAASSLPAAAAASTAAPPPSTRVRSPPPPVKKAAAVRLPTPSPLPAQSQPQTELRAPPPQVHAPPIFNHQVHHQLQHYNSLNNISSRSSSASSAASASLPKHHLPPSPHFAGHPSSNPALPLSIASLATSHYSLRPPPHHHPAMFATPATLPPPPTLPTNSLVVPGHPSGAGFPDTSLLISFNQPIMYCQPHSGILIGTLSQATLLPPPMSPHAENPHSMSWRNRECQFDKYAPKLDNPFLRHSSFYPSYPQTMSGMPPLLPHTGPFSSPHGAFQPSKASNPLDVAGRPGGVPHTLLQKDPRVSDPYRTPVRKPGKWCAVHVQIAWQIYHHQQKMKQMQVEPHKLDMNGKLDLFSRPPAPGVFPGFPYPHDLARPLFSSTGTGHPAAASPYGHSPHHSSFLPTGHLAGKYPFSRSSSFGSLGSLGTSAFGGLGNPSIAPSSVFGHKEGHGLPGFSSPHHDTWNRLHRAPPSFPTPPQWPKAADVERSSSVTNHDRERDREPEKRDSSIGREERDKDRDSLDKNRHSNRSSPASAPGSYQISSLIRSNSQTSSDSSRQHSSSTERSREPERELLERQRESALTGDIKVKESRSPGKEMPIQEMTKPAHQPPSPYGKPILTDAGLKLKDGERKAGEPPSAELLHKVKNDVKIKEERKEDQEVMVVSMEPPPSQPPPQQQHLHHQPPRCTEMPSPASLHGVPLPHSMPLSMSGVHQVNSLSALDRARMAPFMGINPLVPGRDRVPPPGFTWDPLRDPLREAYRNLDLQRRMDFQLRAEQSHRFPAMFEPERGYRDREPHEYSHHEHLLEARAREHERLRQAEERERMHLREELDRARLHQLHQSPIEGHLPHMPPFMSPLGGMHYHRLSPSAAHNGMLNRTPPTAALSAPPPLVSAGIPRPASPRRTTPLTASEPRDYSPSRKPKEVEAR